MHRLIYTFLLLLLLSACSLLPTAPTAPAAAPMLYRDDFSNPASGWQPIPQGGGTAGYADGAYRITVSAANTDLWSVPGLALSDVRLEVDAIKVSSDRNNRFGLLCRVQNGVNFYVFLVSSDGYYGIARVLGPQYQLLGADSLLPSDKIPQGTAYLRLRADCVKDRLALYVNGQLIHEARDDQLASGDVGLLAGAYNPGADIFFDNFTVYPP
jgi:hypothetical protein